MSRRFIYVLALALGVSVNLAGQTPASNIKVAFISDVHFADLYGNLSNTDFKGIRNPADGQYTLLRTMESQLQSTRIFNENYFAFIAALDDVAKRGIRYVALPGDYSDDGQPVHIKGLQKILKEYNQKYGMQFFITTGNHDPVGPFARDAGKKDFLGEGGMPQPVFSKEGIYKADLEKKHPVAISPDIAELGYEGIMDYLSDFGFFPQPQYRYWASPFSTYSPEDYSFEKAKKASLLGKRSYEIAPGDTIPDASYVVEPLEGLWLLALDGNVYLPNGNGAGKTFSSAEPGYNNVISHKKHLITWVKKLAEMAQQRGKVLVAFSHYPMVDYNDGASQEIAEMMGPDKWQLKRLPSEEVARQFIGAGLRLHFAGHMHINDTGVFSDATGSTLVNIQTPSLAAYIPAYKLLSLKGDGTAEIETVTIDKVEGFDKLFDLYRMEYDFLLKQGSETLWDKKILNTKNYRDFTSYHLQELVRLRFLPQDWPKPFREFLTTASGKDILLMLNENIAESTGKIKSEATESRRSARSEASLKKMLNDRKLRLSDFSQWTGMDLINDFYRLRSADQLALKDINPAHLQQYKFLASLVLHSEQAVNSDQPLVKSLRLFFSIFNKFLKDSPADHFLIDLSTGKLEELPSK